MFVVQLGIFIEFGLNVNVPGLKSPHWNIEFWIWAKITPTKLAVFIKLYPTSEARMLHSKILPQTSKKFTQIYLPYLWHFATLIGYGVQCFHLDLTPPRLHNAYCLHNALQLHNVYCMHNALLLHIVHCTLYIAHCILYAHCTLHIAHCTLYSQCIVTAHCNCSSCCLAKQVVAKRRRCNQCAIGRVRLQLLLWIQFKRSQFPVKCLWMHFSYPLYPVCWSLFECLLHLWVGLLRYSLTSK